MIRVNDKHEKILQSSIHPTYAKLNVVVMRLGKANNILSAVRSGALSMAWRVQPATAC